MFDIIPFLLSGFAATAEGAGEAQLHCQHHARGEEVGCMDLIDREIRKSKIVKYDRSLAKRDH